MKMWAWRPRLEAARYLVVALVGRRLLLQRPLRLVLRRLAPVPLLPLLLIQV